MNLSVTHLPLTAFNPVSIAYKNDSATASNEKLTEKYKVYASGIRALSYNVFEEFCDAVFSKQTALILTNLKNLKDVFDEPLQDLTLAVMVGSCRIQAADTALNNGDTTIRKYGNSLYVGGKGETVVFSLVPLNSNVVELKIGELFLEVSPTYPYDINLVAEKQLAEEYYQFAVEFDNRQIGFKAKTSEGVRFLSYSQEDRKMRCVGLALGKTTINQCWFDVQFETATHFLYGYDPTTKQVKYFNSTESGNNRRTLNIQNYKQTDTNLLVSLPIYDLINNKGNANISLLKTNFSSSDIYNTKI